MRPGKARHPNDLRAVLAVPDFRMLWASQAASELGDWAARLALALLVFDRTGSAALTGLVAAASFLPWLGVGQALSTLGDRYPRRTVMIVADLLRAAVFLGMTSALPVWVLMLGALVAASATPAFTSAKAALLPDVVPADLYPSAVTMVHVTAQSASIVGYLCGGGLAGLLGARAALAVNSGTFLVSAFAVSRLDGGQRRVSRGLGGRMRTAASAVVGDASVRWAVLLVCMAGATGMVAEALVPAYARSLGMSSVGAGGLAAIMPLGAVAAVVATPRRNDHQRLFRQAARLILLGSALAVAGFFLSPSPRSAVAAYLGVGVVFGAAAPLNTLVGARLPDQVRSSAWGLVAGFIMASQAIGASAGGVFGDWLGLAPAQGLAMLACLFCTGAVAAVAGRARGTDRARIRARTRAVSARSTAGRAGQARDGRRGDGALQPSGVTAG